MLNFIKSAYRKEDFPKDKNQVVFVGRSNVGKSSLINSLYNQNIAYVGKTPGKTRMLNFFSVDESYYLVDAPGYGYAKRNQSEIIQFGDMMDAYFTKNKNLKLCVMIVDIRHKPTTDDIDMIDFLKDNRIFYIVVANKKDKVSNNELFKQKKVILETLDIPDSNLICVSALKKNDLGEIKSLIDKRVSVL